MDYAIYTKMSLTQAERFSMLLIRTFMFACKYINFKINFRPIKQKRQKLIRYRMAIIILEATLLGLCPPAIIVRHLGLNSA